MKKLAIVGAAVALLLLSGLASASPPPHTRTIVVAEDDLANCGPLPAAPTCNDAHHGRTWFFYDDNADKIDNTLGSFVYCQYGPCPMYDGSGSNPPLGSGSAQISTLGSRRPNLATYQFGGVKLADIKTLGYSTYNPSVGNGAGIGSTRSGYLQFNIDFIGNSTAYQRRITFVPSVNGPVPQNVWKAWDAIDGALDGSQGALWTYSGGTWPAGVGPCVAAGGSKTWGQILACYPAARILPGDSFLGIRVGEPYANGYTENIDAVKFGTSQYTLTFDFETNSPNHNWNDTHHNHHDVDD